MSNPGLEKLNKREFLREIGIFFGSVLTQNLSEILEATSDEIVNDFIDNLENESPWLSEKLQEEDETDFYFIKELFDLLTEKDAEIEEQFPGWKEDFFAAEDFEFALNYVYGILVSLGPINETEEETFQYFIGKGFFLN